MAIEHTFQAIINFNFASHQEAIDMMDLAQTFASNNGGDAKILTSENPNEPFYGKLTLILPIASTAEANSHINAINSTLDNLPERVLSNGYKLEYTYKQREI